MELNIKLLQEKQTQWCMQVWYCLVLAYINPYHPSCVGDDHSHGPVTPHTMLYIDASINICNVVHHHVDV
jgi:hypothetical protein